MNICDCVGKLRICTLQSLYTESVLYSSKTQTTHTTHSTPTPPTPNSPQSTQRANASSKHHSLVLFFLSVLFCFSSRCGGLCLFLLLTARAQNVFSFPFSPSTLRLIQRVFYHLSLGPKSFNNNQLTRSIKTINLKQYFQPLPRYCLSAAQSSFLLLCLCFSSIRSAKNTQEQRRIIFHLISSQQRETKRGGRGNVSIQRVYSGVVLIGFIIM